MIDDRTTNINNSWIRTILKSEDGEPQMDKPDLSMYHALLDTRSGELYPITVSPFRIGRKGPENTEIDLSIDDALISHIHAHIFSENGQEYIVDDKSMNGTFLNGKQLKEGEPAPLYKNDDIRLANIKLIYL